MMTSFFIFQNQIEKSFEKCNFVYQNRQKSEKSKFWYNNRFFLPGHVFLARRNFFLKTARRDYREARVSRFEISSSEGNLLQKMSPNQSCALCTRCIKLNLLLRYANDAALQVNIGQVVSNVHSQ